MSAFTYALIFVALLVPVSIVLGLHLILKPEERESVAGPWLAILRAIWRLNKNAKLFCEEYFSRVCHDISLIGQQFTPYFRRIYKWLRNNGIAAIYKLKSHYFSANLVIPKSQCVQPDIPRVNEDVHGATVIEAAHIFTQKREKKHG